MVALGKTKKTLIIIGFLFPSLLGLLLFNIIPLVSSFFLSLTQWDVIGGMPKFLGLENYKVILQSEEFWRVLKNTLYFIILYLPLIVALSLLVAILLNNKYKGIGIYRTLYYIPVLTSWVAGALVWKWVLDPQYGVINTLLSYIGIKGPGWLFDANWAMPSIVLASVWKDLGFFALILLSGLQGIDSGYFEAAAIDGASWWQKFTKIIVPLISPSIFFVIVISVINSFQLFPQIMIMTKGGEGGPHGMTQVMVERIYKYAFKYYKMGFAAAFSWLLGIIIFFATIIQFQLQKRWVNYDS